MSGQWNNKTDSLIKMIMDNLKQYIQFKYRKNNLKIMNCFLIVAETLRNNNRRKISDIQFFFFFYECLIDVLILSSLIVGRGGLCLLLRNLCRIGEADSHVPETTSYNGIAMKAILFACLISFVQ